MGDLKAFLTIPRKEAGYRPIHERIGDFSEVEQTLNTHDRREQAARCMDCGVPFCHWACPLIYTSPEVAPYNNVLPAMILFSASKLLRIRGRNDIFPPLNPFPK
ncbi:Glutamate synthase [NADPH] small chain [termite gut metagenome]|uniref:Glutamate synthase [NADPH] small chain n=1 Tax=termite gut metagenome TaxID=433724 RepID=A0A5J4P9F8_9ZZZZ